MSKEWNGLKREHVDLSANVCREKYSIYLVVQLYYMIHMASENIKINIRLGKVSLNNSNFPLLINSVKIFVNT